MTRRPWPKWVALFAAAVLSSPAEQAPSISDLLRDLSSGPTLARRDAAMRLADLGPDAAAAVPALIRALDDDEQQVWFGAVTALAKIGPPAKEAIPALLEGLKRSPRGGWRQAYFAHVTYRSSYALAQIGLDAIPALTHALKAAEPSVRAGAARAFTWMGPAAAAVAPSLAECLADSDADVRQLAAEALGQIGTEALPQILPVLTHSNPPARSAAARAIAEMGAPARAAASPELLKSFSAEGEPGVRAVQLQTLLKLRLPPAELAPPLLDALRHSHAPLRVAAMNGLLLLNSPERWVVPGLIELMAADGANSQALAADLLGRIGPAAAPAIPHLIAAIQAGQDAPPDFTYSEALIGIGPPAAPALFKALEKRPLGEIQPNFWPVRCLIAIGAQSQSTITNALHHPAAPVRLAALHAFPMNVLSPRAAAGIIEAALADAEPAVRAAACSRLARIGSSARSALPALRDHAAHDDSEIVRREAEEAVRRIQGP